MKNAIIEKNKPVKITYEIEVTNKMQPTRTQVYQYQSK